MMIARNYPVARGRKNRCGARRGRELMCCACVVALPVSRARPPASRVDSPRSSGHQRACQHHHHRITGSATSEGIARPVRRLA